MLAFIVIHNGFENVGDADNMRLVLFILLIAAILLILIGSLVALYTFFSYLKYRSSRVDPIHS
jgi:hypothetical protein